MVIHRYYRTYDVEDLINLVVDAAEFLLRVEQNMDSGAMVPRSIRNVLFTRMSNVASNYLYKLRRLVPVSSMAVDGDTEGDRVQPGYSLSRAFGQAMPLMPCLIAFGRARALRGVAWFRSCHGQI